MNSDSSSTTRTYLISGLLVGALLGGGIGYWVGGKAQSSHGRNSGTESSAVASVGKTSDVSDADETASGGSATVAGGRGGGGGNGGAITKEFLVEQAKDFSMFRGYGPTQLRKILAFQERLSRQDVKPLVEELLDDRSPDAGMALFLAMGVYAEQDPMEALELVIARGDTESSGMGSYQAVATSMALDPEGTMDRIKRIENATMRRQMMGAAQGVLASKDPERAFEMYLKDAESPEGSSEDNTSAYTIFYQWARKDPKAAAAALDRIKDPQQRQQSINSVASQWATSDPEAAWKWANSLSSEGESHNDPRANVLGQWARKDPSGALLKAGDITDERVRTQAYSSIMSQWAAKSPDEAIAWAASISDSYLRAQVLQPLSHMDSVPPAKVFELFLEHLPSGDTFQNSLGSLMQRWSKNDPVAAAAALSKVPPGDAVNNSVNQIASQWAKRDAAAAFQWLSSLPGGSGKQNGLSAYFTEIGRTDPQGALRQLAALEGEESSRALNSLIGSWSKRDPGAASRWVLNIANDDQRRNAITTVAQNMASKSPPEAATWVMQVRESDRSGAMASLVDQWAQRDLESAAEWLNNVPATKTRDEAVGRLANKLAREDPEGGIAWAATITDEGHRQRVQENLARNWMRNAPNEARVWVTQSSLSQEKKDGLLKVK